MGAADLLEASVKCNAYSGSNPKMKQQEVKATTDQDLRKNQLSAALSSLSENRQFFVPSSLLSPGLLEGIRCANL